MGSFHHPAVPRDFCDDGRCGNTWFFPVSIDDRAMGIVEPELVAPVDEDVRRRHNLCHARERFLHGFLRRLEDADAVDLRCVRNADAVRAVFLDPEESFFSVLLRELLAVSDEACGEGCAVHAGSCYHWSCERTAPCFIDADDDGCR